MGMSGGGTGSNQYQTRGSSRAAITDRQTCITQPDLKSQIDKSGTLRIRCGEIRSTRCRAWVSGPSWAHGGCNGDIVVGRLIPGDVAAAMFLDDKLTHCPAPLVQEALVNAPPGKMSRRQIELISTTDMWDTAIAHGWGRDNRETISTMFVPNLFNKPAGSPSSDYVSSLLPPNVASLSNHLAYRVRSHHLKQILDLKDKDMLRTLIIHNRASDNADAIMRAVIDSDDKEIIGLCRDKMDSYGLSSDAVYGIYRADPTLSAAQWLLRSRYEMDSDRLQRLWDTHSKSATLTDTMNLADSMMSFRARDVSPQQLVQMAKKGHVASFAVCLCKGAPLEPAEIRAGWNHCKTHLRVLRAIADHPNTPTDVLSQAWKMKVYRKPKEVQAVRENILSHPNCPPAIRRRVLLSQGSQLQVKLASMPDLSIDEIRLLLASPNSQVRRVVTKNPVCPSYVADLASVAGLTT